MLDQFKFILLDVSGNFTEFNFADYARPGFFVLWLAILATPLVGVDRRDRVSGTVYSLFVATAGVVLMFALPQRWMDKSVSLIGQLVMVIFMAVAGFLRWELGKDRYTSVQVLRGAATQEGEVHREQNFKKERKKRG